MKYNRNDENYVYYFIGKNIAKYRKAKGWTQEELANKAMYSKQFISNIENNVLVQTVLEFMEKQNHWQGNATDLYNMLRAYVSDYGIIGFPKSSSWLTRDLKSLLSIFESQNIKIEFLKATNKGSNIKLTKF